jgi:hypothetical protein
MQEPTRQSLRFDEVPQVGAKENAIAGIMQLFDELLENRIEFPAGSLYEIQGQGLEFTSASRYKRLRIALSGNAYSFLDHERRSRKVWEENSSQCFEAVRETPGRLHTSDFRWDTCIRAIYIGSLIFSKLREGSDPGQGNGSVSGVGAD